MAWTFVGAHIETGTANTPPTGAAADDVLFCLAVNTGSGNTLTPPAGWTEVESDPGAADFAGRLFYRVMQTGDTTWTWTWSGGTRIQATCAIRGADTTTPLDDTSVTKTSSTANSLTTASVTPAVAGELFLGVWAADAASRTWTETGTLTEQLDGNGGSTLDVLFATEELAGTSAVTRTGTISGTAQDMSAWAVVLTAASSGVTVDGSGGTATAGGGAAGKTVTLPASGGSATAAGSSSGETITLPAAAGTASAGGGTSAANILTEPVFLPHPQALLDDNPTDAPLDAAASDAPLDARASDAPIDGHASSALADSRETSAAVDGRTTTTTLDARTTEALIDG